ncbi:hypothetical protein [Roseovarius atlanticus]|uniref:hypothetical protein n=1 Tax=Roseovarius atlanticus TaxID=1641875 RepID=UPI001C946F7B|nr:hypothetical protein [Roseovarius atlanticus]MBY5988185.1 hypothetical protein [Roseovarius atlanticus]MBY6123576.1 hypothetical protein [Roseovarius atlanticus]MBY6148071.1 hypothetical protein [Roseovarius atlanticus]
MSAYITASDVASMCGYSSGAAFLQDRKRLERDLDFPCPMPTCQRPLKWARSAVAAWVQQRIERVSGHRHIRAVDTALMAEARRA